MISSETTLTADKMAIAAVDSRTSKTSCRRSLVLFPQHYYSALVTA